MKLATVPGPSPGDNWGFVRMASVPLTSCGLQKVDIDNGTLAQDSPQWDTRWPFPRAPPAWPFKGMVTLVSLCIPEPSQPC